MVFDGGGNQVTSTEGGTNVHSGPVTIPVVLPFDTAPGTYTIGFEIGDAQKTKFYGLPTGGEPVPGGPLVTTVTG